MFSDDIKLRKIQECCLQSLQEIAIICKDNDISFFLCGGSLLGAIRNNGFIPWDNDIDIIMPRKDYIKFIKVANSKLPKGFILKHYSLCKAKNEINIENAQVVNTNLSFFRSWTKTKEKINPWVDIFVIDGVSNNLIIRNIDYYRYKILQKIFQLSISDKIINITKKRNLFERTIIKFINVYNPFLNIDSLLILHKMNLISEKNINIQTKYICNYSGTYGRKEIMKAEYYDSSIQINFEGLECKIPSKYDIILRNIYKNYLTEKKVANHSIID